MNQENKRKIILIDDNAILRTIFGYMLQGFSDYPIEFYPFKNALDALDFLDTHDISASLGQPILFVDINMPFMTGWELMDVLEDKSDFINQTKIFIISSSTSKSDQEQLENYPFISDFILKPFGKELLYEILRQSC
ncbi:response regulator [Sphingobacterium sp. ML3W]|uniref:response regulator n=1 Tax=Sphingobacterium sp. ML3W TaxID=1538644 RepID=UPI00249B9D3D|nr:response regulator [Sphingobacterium sp. ML3W]WFA77729.1 response regulator [Sphingobacterium sp. ML3W]